MAVVPSPDLLATLGQTEAVLLAAATLVLAGFFAVLRTALLHSVPRRVLEETPGEERRAVLQPLLESAESLATSASVFEKTFQILFVGVVLGSLGNEVSLPSLAITLCISVPLLVFAAELMPGSLRGESSDQLLRSVLPLFHLLQRPLAALIIGLEATRRLFLRLLRIEAPPPSARRIVEGIRDVIEDSDRKSELRESEREIIENIVDFHDLDVAEIMTPRTELMAVEVRQDLMIAVDLFSKSGHTRLPVYERTLDKIVGVAHATEVLSTVAGERFDEASLESVLQPVAFVPETKLVSEMLTEFRGDKLKMAVVLDEYGGTSGIVTMGDIVSEIVGDMREELGEPAPEPFRRRPDGSIEIEAATRVSEVNEEFEDECPLELPEEEDYETLAGFVLAQMGRFPKTGESFEWHAIQFSILEANDRRVLRVLLRPPDAQQAG